MSEEQSVEKTSDKSIYVAQEDIDAITRFFKHFKFVTSKEFDSAVEAFQANPTLETQKNLRFNIAKECLRTKGQNELIDDLFKNVVTTSDKISYDIQFEKDLEEVIGVDSKQDQVSKP